MTNIYNFIVIKYPYDTIVSNCINYSGKKTLETRLYNVVFFNGENVNIYSECKDKCECCYGDNCKELMYMLEFDETEHCCDDYDKDYCECDLYFGDK